MLKMRIFKYLALTCFLALVPGAVLADYTIVLTSGKVVVAAEKPAMRSDGSYLFRTATGQDAMLYPGQLDEEKTKRANLPKPEEVSTTTTQPRRATHVIDEQQLAEAVEGVHLSNESPAGELQGSDYGSLSAASAAGTGAASSADLQTQLSRAKSDLASKKSERESAVDNLPHLYEPAEKEASEKRIADLAKEIAQLESRISTLEADVRRAETTEATEAAATEAAETVAEAAEEE